MELLSIFERYPFSRLCIALILGIWISNCYSGFSNLAYPVAGSLFIIITISTFFATNWKYRWINGGCWILFFVAVGYLILTPITTLPQSLAESKSEILATIIRQTTTKSGAIQLVANIEKSTKNDSLLRNKKLLLTIAKPQKDLNLTNALISTITTIEPIYPSNNPGAFDYNRYLLNKAIFGKGFITKYKIIESGIYSVSLSQKIASKANFWLKSTYRSLGFKEDELGVMLALIDGDRGSISSEVKLDYQQTGTTHILAVSGLHVGIIMEMFLFLFGWLDRFGMRITKVVIIISLLWLYAIISGLEASILRATIMFSILLIARQLDRNVKLENSLFLSAFLILLIVPTSLFEAGFWLSYLAVASIILFSSRIEAILKFNNYVAKKTWQLVAVTLSAQVATLPYILFLFGTFPTYFLISNLLILPIVPVAMFGGIGVASLSFITTQFTLINKIVIYTIAYMNGVVDFLQKLPMAQINGLGITFYNMLQIYLIMVLLLLYHQNKKASYLFYAQSVAIILFSMTAVNSYNNRRGSELVVFANKELLVITKNENRYRLITPKLNKQVRNLAKKYIAKSGCEDDLVDTTMCLQNIVPFFKGNKFGVIVENMEVLNRYNQLKYKPNYIVINHPTNHAVTKNNPYENCKDLTLIANHFDYKTFKYPYKYWNITLDGAFIE